MKLVFGKNEELEISVQRVSGGDTSDFSYIDMINDLICTQKLDAPELNGEFSEAEKDSINSMIEHINEAVASFYSEEEDGDQS